MPSSFPQVHSETLVIIGAGSTAGLGFPVTDSQTKIFRNLADSSKSSSEVLNKYFSNNDLKKVKLFLKILDCSDCDYYEVDKVLDDGKVLFDCNDDSLVKRRIHELRREYDWDAAKKIIKICPENEDNDNLIRDLYSLIDGKLLHHQSLKVISNDKEEILSESRLNGARNFITLFINMLFASCWYKIANGENAENFNKYKSFVNAFDRLMQKEGSSFSSKYNLWDRDFYLFSTSFVSFNFEMVFPWLFMNSHYELNHQKTYIKARPLNLWIDYGVEHRSRKLDDEKNVIPTLEFTEAVASRENEKDYIGTEINRCGKFYFAHGSSYWRECPVCGRMTFYTGDTKDKWNYKSKNLIPAFPIPLFDIDKINEHTKKENQWRKELKYDSLECMHCGAETKSFDSPMIMQTMYKSIPTSFLEEIQRNVKVSLENARHIVLLGYSLPVDDTIWQHAFAECVKARKEGKKAYCSVVNGRKGEERWIYPEEMNKFIKKYEKDPENKSWISSIKNAIAIFGEQYVRVWTGGIPQVFGNCNENDVKELLYPLKFCNWNDTRLEN